MRFISLFRTAGGAGGDWSAGAVYLVLCNLMNKRVVVYSFFDSFFDWIVIYIKQPSIVWYFYVIFVTGGARFHVNIQHTKLAASATSNNFSRFQTSHFQTLLSALYSARLRWWIMPAKAFRRLLLALCGLSAGGILFIPI